MSKFSDELQNLLGDHQPKEIEELCLDEFTENIKSLQPYQKEGLQLYNNLIHLSLNNIGLENLENFPEIKCLMILSLKNNKLKGDDFSIIPELYTNLYKLKISFNQIESIDNLSSLKKMKLKKLEVKENPFTKNDNEYRDKIYNMLPSLDIIDQMMKNGQEVDTTDYGYDSSSSDDEEDENMEDNEDEEDDDDSDEKDGNSNDSEEEYYEENEDDEGGKKKKKK